MCVGLDVPQPLHVRVLDAGLDRGGVPAADDHRRAHLHGEGALLLEVREHRLQPVVQVRRVPVDDRALGQVREIALDLGQLAVQHQAGADQLAGPSSNQPRFSERHSVFTSAHAGTWQWLAEGRLWMYARCCSRLMVLRVRLMRGAPRQVCPHGYRGSGSRAEAYCARGAPRLGRARGRGTVGR